VPRPPAIGIVTCTGCRANVPLTEPNQMLCAGCGAVVPPSIDACSCCGARGKSLPTVALDATCAYCGTGTMQYRSIVVEDQP
jgi:predicted amidophosphoribosyltransferase